MRAITSIPPLPRRNPEAHKGDFGRALIIGGSVGMPGAPMLAAAAALRSGCGLVELAVPWSVWIPAAARFPAALVRPLAETPEGTLDASAEEISSILDPATAIAIGPGMGKGEGAIRTLKLVLDRRRTPCVFDADALNILAAKVTEGRSLGLAAVLTPHPGEMARLAGRTRDEVQADRNGIAAAYAREHGVVLVLKGPGTIVTDGDRVFTNTNGTHALARGGTGDVLTGVICGLLAQKMEPFDAAVLGVHVHGMAGDIAHYDKGAMGMTVEDVVEALPMAWKKA